MKIAFYGGQTAGIVTLLTLLASRKELSIVFPEDDSIERVSRLFKLNQKDKYLLKDLNFLNDFKSKANILICCHGRIILPKKLVTSIKCINLHPCLYKYKGAHPIARLIQDKNSKASVASHWMVEEVDAGETIIEEFTKISNIEIKNEAEVYNDLYPLYARVLVRTLSKIGKQ